MGFSVIGRGVPAWVLATAMLAAPAWAQTAGQPTAAEPDGGLQEIVVTARKVSENLQSVPVAITAFSGAALEAKNVTRVADAIGFTPGFTAREATGNVTALLLTMRGQVQTEVLATLDPSVGTYNDELYWARAYGLNANLVDVSNVQVLKGPQGTLFGRNTTGGALLITTNDPEFDGFSGSAAATYGRFNEAAGELVVNAPLNDVVALRGALRISHRDGWAHGVRLINPATGLPDNGNNPANIVQRTGQTFNGRDEIQGRVKALVRLSDATKLILSSEIYHFRMDGPGRWDIYKVLTAADGAVTAGGIARYVSYLADHPNDVALDGHDCQYAVTQPAANCFTTLRDGARVYTKTDTQTYMGKLTQELGFGEAKLIGGYRHVKGDNNLDLDGSATIIHTTTLKQNLSQWSIEAQMTGKAIDDRLDFAAGATYLREWGTDLSYSFSNLGGNIRPSATRNYGRIVNNSYGVYSQATFSMTDRLHLTGGLRYSIDRKALELGSANTNLAGQLAGLALGAYVAGTLTDPCNAAGAGTPTGATPANDCRSSASATFKALSWTAGADYRFGRDLLAYAKASRGYRSGGHNVRAFNDAQLIPFKPEYVYEQEIGFKSDLFDRHVRFNVAAYRNLVKGAQRQVSFDNGNGINNQLIRNAATVRNLGGEAELTIVPTHGLTLGASAAYNKSRYLKYQTIISGVTFDLSNERIQYLPEWQFTLSGQYSTELSSALSATLNVDYAWTGKNATDNCSVTGASQCWTGGADINGRTNAQITQDIIAASTVPASGILNARLTLGIDQDRYRLAFWGRNLGNNRAYLQGNFIKAAQRNYVAGFRREPLTFGATASTKF